MGLFSKKKTNTEEIPSLPKLPELPMESLNLPDTPPGLPNIETYKIDPLSNEKTKENLNQAINAFSNTRTDNFNQTIKQEINEPKNNSFFEKSINPLNPYTPEKNNPPISERRTRELPEFNNSNRMTKQAEPIYIRLDKFETTVEAFKEIKNKIIEIEDLLERTKKIKQDEEKELDSWEREIQMIKSRIDLIDKSIFNKLD